MLNKRVDAANAAHPEHEGGHVSCPGQRTISTREKSMKDGVSVEDVYKRQVGAMALQVLPYFPPSQASWRVYILTAPLLVQ